MKSTGKNTSPHTTREAMLFAVYYAPRGRVRLYHTAAGISQRHLLPTDLLIGILGLEGSGKSTVIKGLFPGLELTNDDEGVNIKKAPVYDFNPDDSFSGHTFHIDARYEMAFRQKFEIAEAVKNAVSHNRRVIVEHFDLLYDVLGFNAQVLIGIGEEIIVARPTIFGPFPGNIKAIVDKTVIYRFMAHSAEDITSHILNIEYQYDQPVIHSDVRHGFVISFSERPAIDIAELEKKVLKIIADDVRICSAGEDRIRIGDSVLPCTGVRTHVKSSGCIHNFRLFKEFQYDSINDEWLLVGKVGGDELIGFDNIISMPDKL